MHAKLRPLGCLLLSFVLPATMSAQDAGTLKELATRMERLERENRVLASQVQQLRDRLQRATEAMPEADPDGDQPAVPMGEQLAVQDRRIEEHSQTKVESSQKLPIKITGTILFNTFLNSRNNGGSENPTIAALTPGQSTSGATMRQTILGFRYHSPQTLFGARVNGYFDMDFFAGTTVANNHLVRLRVAQVSLDWKNQSVSVGYDKPLISPRDPNTLSQVGNAPLTNTGNPWLWRPQVRVEQRFTATEFTTLRLQGSIYGTSEQSVANVPAEFVPTIARMRPGYEARFEVAHTFGENKRVEVGTGFHGSTSHVAATSVPSRIYTVDWLFKPLRLVELSGLYYQGQNTAHLGTLRQGYTVLGRGSAIPVHSAGGWTQVSVPFTSRLTWNLFHGQHDDRNRDLRLGNFAKNQASGTNLMLRIAPNVITSAEYLQLRTSYVGRGTRLHNHYDLAVAYLF